MSRADARWILLGCLLLGSGPAWAQSEVEAAVLRRAAQGFELARWDDPLTWELLLAAAPEDRTRAMLITGIGRVGSPQLIPLITRELERWAIAGRGAPVARALALAVGLSGDDALFGRAVGAQLSGAELSLALGLLGRIPGDVPGWWEAVLRPGVSSVEDPAILGDPVVAALVHLARLPAPELHVLAQRTLETEVDPRRLAAAAYRFARGPTAPPAECGRRLQALLGHADREAAGQAARALARVVGREEEAAAALRDAYLSGGHRVVQADRLEALGKLGRPAGLPALAAALESPDPDLRRLAFEALPAVAAGGPSAGDWGRVAGEVAERDAVSDVRRAALLAHAALDPTAFVRGFARSASAADPRVQAAALRAGLGNSAVPSAELWAAMARSPRGVRVAFLEAVRERLADGTWREQRADLLELAITGLAAAAAGESTAWDGADGPDPVLLGLGAGILADLDRAEDGAHHGLVTEVADALTEQIPAGEVEAWQALVELCARDATDRGTQRLRRLLTVTPLPDIQRRTRESLAARGGSAPPSPRPEPWLGDAEPVPTGALILTDGGTIELRLRSDLAPNTVRTFARLAAAGYFDSGSFHRVVPGFVAQGGCPRGDGWGGPGWTQPCEVSPVTYRRGTVGMALAGKDTGGSQFFIAHRDVPHLDARYSVFAEVVRGFEVLDALVPGSQIRAVTLRPTPSPR